MRLPERAERGRARGVRPGCGAADAGARRVPGHGSSAPGAELEEPGRAAGRVRLRPRTFGYHARSPVAPDRGYHRAQRQDRSSVLRQPTVFQVLFNEHVRTKKNSGGWKVLKKKEQFRFLRAPRTFISVLVMPRFVLLTKYIICRKVKTF